MKSLIDYENKIMTLKNLYKEEEVKLKEKFQQERERQAQILLNRVNSLIFCVSNREILKYLLII